jgi:hypothetical protein
MQEYCPEIQQVVVGRGNIFIGHFNIILFVRFQPGNDFFRILTGFNIGDIQRRIVFIINVDKEKESLIMGNWK